MEIDHIRLALVQWFYREFTKIFAEQRFFINNRQLLRDRLTWKSLVGSLVSLKEQKAKISGDLP